jgi:hypothetical protein
MDGPAPVTAPSAVAAGTEWKKAKVGAALQYLFNRIPEKDSHDAVHFVFSMLEKYVEDYLDGLTKP